MAKQKSRHAPQSDSYPPGPIRCGDKIERAGYALVSRLLILDKKISADAKNTYHYLRGFLEAANWEGWPASERLILELGISVEEARAHLAELVDRGLLTCTGAAYQLKPLASVYTMEDVEACNAGFSAVRQ